MIRRLLLFLLLATPCLAQTNYNLYLKLPGYPPFQLVPCLNCEFGGGSGTGTTYFAGHGLTLSGNTFAIDPTIVLLNGNPQINGQSIFNGGNILINTGIVYSASNGVLLAGSTFSADPSVVVLNGQFTINVVGGPTNAVSNGGSITIPASISSGGGAFAHGFTAIQGAQTITSAMGTTNIGSSAGGWLNTSITVTNTSDIGVWVMFDYKVTTSGGDVGGSISVSDTLTGTYNWPIEGATAGGVNTPCTFHFVLPSVPAGTDVITVSGEINSGGTLNFNNGSSQKATITAIKL